MIYKDPSTDGYMKLCCAMIILAIKDSRCGSWRARYWLETTGVHWLEVLNINIDIDSIAGLPNYLPDYEEILKK